MNIKDLMVFFVYNWYDEVMTYLKDNYTGKIGNPLTSFEVIKNNDVFSFVFEAHDSSLESFSNKDNDDLWRLNVVEVFLDMGDDFYYEFEVAPNGKTFIAKISNGNVSFFDCDFFSSNVETSGSTYKVKLVIDLSIFKNKKEIRYNVFRVETKNVGDKQNLQALSPTFCDTFHIKDKFISLR